MRSIIITSLLCTLAFCSAAFGQTPHPSVEALRQAASSLSSAEEIRQVAGFNLEVGALRCLNEHDTYAKKELGFTDYVNARMGPNFDKTSPRLALVDEIQMAAPNIKKGAEFLRVCAGIIPASEKRQDFVAFADLMKRAVAGELSTLATLYALSKTLRFTAITLAQGEALRANRPYDTTRDTPILRLALSDISEAIRYDPMKKYFIQRAEIYKRLGDQAAANADIAKAATMTN